VKEAVDATELPPVTGQIVFDKVAFGYDPAIPVIHDVSLTIAPGETVAFVGPTGAGKSTLAKLIVRFYDPTEGRSSSTGTTSKSVTLEITAAPAGGGTPGALPLRRGPSATNISFARPDASDEEVDEAVRTVGLSDLIERMPNGVDTIVHERGQSLSSGERQLIALARAFPGPSPGARSRRGHLQPGPPVGDEDRGGPRLLSRPGRPCSSPTGCRRPNEGPTGSWWWTRAGSLK